MSHQFGHPAGIDNAGGALVLGIGLSSAPAQAVAQPEIVDEAKQVVVVSQPLPTLLSDPPPLRLSRRD